jgi:hypothetical protein
MLHVFEKETTHVLERIRQDDDWSKTVSGDFD